MSRAVPAPAAAAREEREGGRESRGVAEPNSPLAAPPRGLEAVARGDRTGRPLPITAPTVRFPHSSSLFFPSPIPSPAPSSSFPSPLPPFTSLLSLQPRPRPHPFFNRSTPSPKPPAPPAVLLAPHGFSMTLPSPPGARQSPLFQPGRLACLLPISLPSWRYPSPPPAFLRCPRAALSPSASPASHFEAFCKPLPELPLSSSFSPVLTCNFPSSTSLSTLLPSFPPSFLSPYPSWVYASPNSASSLSCGLRFLVGCGKACQAIPRMGTYLLCIPSVFFFFFFFFF